MYAEDVPVAEIAAKVGTPFFVYSQATLTRHYKVFNQAFEGAQRLVCYSAKANSSMAILTLLKNLGAGLDIVSGGELYRGLKAGFAPQRIVYSGVGKRVDEIDDALGAGILMFNIESLQELELIDARAQAAGKKAPVALRVNPDVDPQTHPYIATGLKKSKFGVDTVSALEGYRTAKKMENIQVMGIDCHIGSQITKIEPFKDALNSVLGLAAEIRALGIDLTYLDMGGGLGITYDNETPPEPKDYAQAVTTAVKQSGLKLILEPGRVIVGNAGLMVTRVLFLKTGQTKEFIIVDAGMNDLIRPTLYQAYHNIKPVVRGQKESITADVVGPICESGDFLAQDRKLPAVERDDLLAVFSTGAYGFNMSSNYNSRPRAAEVMVCGDRFEVIRKRQDYTDLIAGESVPDFIK